MGKKSKTKSSASVETENVTAYVIEDDVPLVKVARSGRKLKYPWGIMREGQSIFFTEEQSLGARASALNFATANKLKFACRAVEGGMRVYHLGELTAEELEHREAKSAKMAKARAQRARQSA